MQMTRLSQATKSHAQTLWDYHRLRHDLQRSDFILALGSHDERVAEHAAKLFLDGMAPLLVTSGGFGKVTREAWKVTEGRRFAEIAEAKGVPRAQILVEEEATNTGANLLFSRELLSREGRSVTSGILVTKPYMCRRAYAAAMKQWPGMRWEVDAPNLSFDEYPNEEVPQDRMINLMVGDLQRLDVYAAKGFQIEQSIPSSVWDSYQALKNAGYDRFVLPDV